MVRKLEGKFYGIELHHILRRDNEEVNALAKLASTRARPPQGVFIDVLDTPSIRFDGGGRAKLRFDHRYRCTDPPRRRPPNPEGQVVTVTTRSHLAARSSIDTLGGSSTLLEECAEPSHTPAISAE